MTRIDSSLQLLPELNPNELSGIHKLALAILSIGFLLFVSVLTGASASVGWAGLALMVTGSLTWILHKRHAIPGIKNNGIMFSGASSRGMLGWMLGMFITGFYVILYFYPQNLQGLITLVSPINEALTGKPSDSQWFLYGFLYTISILVMGVRALIKYRHSRYQVMRTLSVMASQLFLAFLIPNILMRLNDKYYNWPNIWPLNFYDFNPGNFHDLAEKGALGKFAIFWAIVSILIVTPALTYYFGKRWYCSWVCGCGGLAETLGDPFRQNSSKSLLAWKIERWSIHIVLVLVVITTGLMFVSAKWNILWGMEGFLKEWYGFLIMSIFSGVIGTGFYPIFGSRVWCSFGCPMAAVLGLLQRRFSRFRITTNGDQCISCGNCSTYCEMGIDVRSYAQRGENIVRASCVGCGVCSSVCPRGVLNLESGPLENLFKE